jgi:hypothetical protein
METEVQHLRALLSEARKFVDFCRFQALAPSGDASRPAQNYREDLAHAHDLSGRIEEALKYPNRWHCES